MTTTDPRATILALLAELTARIALVQAIAAECPDARLRTRLEQKAQAMRARILALDATINSAPFLAALDSASLKEQAAAIARSMTDLVGEALRNHA